MDHTTWKESYGKFKTNPRLFWKVETREACIKKFLYFLERVWRGFEKMIKAKLQKINIAQFEDGEFKLIFGWFKRFTFIICLSLCQ